MGTIHGERFGYTVWQNGQQESGTVEGVNDADHARRLVSEVYKAHYGRVVFPSQVQVTGYVTERQREGARRGRAWAW